VLVTNALLFVITWAVLRFSPSFLIGLVPHDQPELQPITDAASRLIIALSHDIGWQFAIAGLVFSAFSIIVYAIAIISKLRHKGMAPASTPKKAAAASA
jgi:hypothetical protein